jgi:hypothetical protein
VVRPDFERSCNTCWKPWDRVDPVVLADLEHFRAIVTDPALAGLPGILEVPGLDGEGPDALNVQRLRDLADGAA